MTEEISRTTLCAQNIPEELKALKLWIVWEVPRWYKGQPKPKKIPRNPDGIGYPTKGFAERKEFGTFDQVIEACKLNPNFYPGVWLTDVPNIICLDYDTLDEKTMPEQPEYNSYTEYSVYLGYHVFCYYTEKELPPNTKNVDYRNNSWLIMTGNFIRGRDKINDLTNELSPKKKEPEEITIEDSEPRKEPKQLTAAPTARHPELRTIVASGVARNHTFKMIMAAAKAANEDFPVPKDKAQIEREVTSLYEWAIKKREAKSETEKRKEKAALPDDPLAEYSEIRIAEKFCEHLNGNYLFNGNTKQWHHWTGKVWEIDKRETLKTEYEIFARLLYTKLASLQSDTRIKAFQRIQFFNSSTGVLLSVRR